MRWLRWLVVLMAVVLLVAGAVAGALAWLAATERGAVWLAAQVSQRTAGIDITGVRGTLWHGLTVDELVTQVAGHRIEVRAATVALEKRELRHRRLSLATLMAAEVVYTRTPRLIGDPAAPAAPATQTPPVQVGQEALSDDVLTWPGRRPITIDMHDVHVRQLRVNNGEQSLLFEESRAALTLSGATLAVHRLETTTANLYIDIAGELTVTDRPAITARWSWQGEFGEREWAGEGSLSGVWPELLVSHDLTLPFQVAMEGDVSLAADVAGSVALSWTDLVVDGYEWIASPQGQLNLSGVWPAFDFDGTAELIVEGEPLRTRFDGSGTPDSLQVAVLEMAGEPGTATFSGELAPPSLSWDLQFEVTDFNPATRFAAWPGRLDISAHTAGELRPEPRWTLSDVVLTGELRDHPFRATGGITHAPGRWALDDLRIQSGANRLSLHGVYAEQLDLELVAQVEDLATLWPEVSGAVSGQVRVFGTRADPQAQGRVVASDISHGDFSVGHLVAVSAVDGRSDTSVELAVDAESLRYAGRIVDQASVQLSGSAGSHQIVMAAGAGDWSARMAASGVLADSAWQGRIDSLVMDQEQLGQWRMQQSTRMALARDRIRVEAVCVVQEGASLCGEVVLEGATTDRVRLTADNFNVRALTPFFPEGFSADGVYDGRLDMTGTTGRFDGGFSVSSPSTAFDIRMAGQPVFASSIEDINVDLALRGDELRLRAGFSGYDTGVVNIRLDTDNVRDADPLVDMQIDLLWPDLAFLALLSPDVADVEGALAVRLSATGLSSAPDVEAVAELEGGAMGVPALGLMVRDIGARATSTDGSFLNFEAAGTIGDREVSVTGTTELNYRESFPTTLTLRGDSVPAVQLPEAEIYVSPDLTAEVRLPDINVRGAVLVPRARIALQELPAQAVSPSADAVVHGVEQPDPTHPLQVRGALNLTLGDDVRYTGMNLDTRVTGDLRLTYQSGRPASATGVVTMNGTYNAYGQLLELERGELIFAGSLLEPALDVRAVRTINATTVGVHLIGPLQSPETRVVSSPAMSEADALAYLLFGRPVTGARGEETATLQSAAIAMGLQQALPVVQRIGEAIGFDEFTVQTTDVDDGALMAGKYLSQNIYIRYTYGLFNGIGGLLLRFRINDRLSLETRSAEHKSMDLLYTVERD